MKSSPSYPLYMLPQFRGDDGNPDMMAWEDYCNWLDTATTRFPLLQEIL